MSKSGTHLSFIILLKRPPRRETQETEGRNEGRSLVSQQRLHTRTELQYTAATQPFQETAPSWSPPLSLCDKSNRFPLQILLVLTVAL